MPRSKWSAAPIKPSGPCRSRMKTPAARASKQHSRIIKAGEKAHDVTYTPGGAYQRHWERRYWRYFLWWMAQVATAAAGVVLALWMFEGETIRYLAMGTGGVLAAAATIRWMSRS